MIDIWRNNVFFVKKITNLTAEPVDSFAVTSLREFRDKNQ